MRSDAEFDLWLDDYQQQIRQIVRRATRRFAILMFTWAAALVAVVFMIRFA